MNAIIAGTGGLGKAIAHRLLTGGHSVVVNSRNEDKLKTQVEELGKFGKIDKFCADLSERSHIDELFRFSTEKFGEVTALVITVGGYFEDSIENPEHLREMIQNHVEIPTHIINAASKWMHGGSSIVLVSSIQSLFTTNWNAFSYTLGKTALNRIVENSAANLLKAGIRVNAVAPSVISRDYTPGREWRKTRKLGDLVTPPEDIATVVSFLIGKDSEWIDGVTIPLDGGHRFV